MSGKARLSEVNQLIHVVVVVLLLLLSLLVVVIS